MILLALLGIAIGVLLAMGLVLVGLVETPWPVLLVGLLAALYGLQRVLVTGQEGVTAVNSADLELRAQRNSDIFSDGQLKKEQIDPVSDDEEILTYRGIRYRVAKPHADANHRSDTRVEGIYRGQHWERWQPTADAPQTKDSPAAEITYRGHKVVKSDPEA